MALLNKNSQKQSKGKSNGDTKSVPPPAKVKAIKVKGSQPPSYAPKIKSGSGIKAMSPEMAREALIARLRDDKPRWQLMLSGELGDYYVGWEGERAQAETLTVKEVPSNKGGTFVAVESSRGIHIPLNWIFYKEEVVPNYMFGSGADEQRRILGLIRRAMPEMIQIVKEDYWASQQATVPKTNCIKPTLSTVAEQALRTSVIAFAQKEIAVYDEKSSFGAATVLPAVNDPHQIALAGCKGLRDLVQGKLGKYLFCESDEGGHDYDMVVELVRHYDGPKLKIVWLDSNHTVASYCEPRGACYEVGTIIGLRLMHVNHKQLFDYMAESVFLVTRVRMRSIVIPRSTASVSVEIAAARTVAKGGIDSVIVAPGHEKPNRAIS